MKDVGAYYRGRPVLVTGGLGFIGANLCIRLVDLGARVTAIDNLMPSYGGNRFNIAGYEDRIRVVVSDIRDEQAIRTLIGGQELLFNMAGQTSHMDSMNEPFTDLDINCTAQLSILETCRRVNPGVRIVFASTRQIYGRPGYLPVDEKHLLNPVDVNGINKMAGEFYHILYNNAHGLWTCALRLTNTYGPRMRIKDARQTFLGVWIRAAIEGRPVSVWGGRQLRDLNYVSDVVDALLVAGATDDARGRTMNLGGNEIVSLSRLAEILVKVNGGGRVEVAEFPEDRKKIDIGDYYGDFALAHKTLGWSPRVGLESGLAQTLGYFRNHIAKYV